MRILREIFRSSSGEVAAPAIMGVCSAIANRFKLDVLAVRVSLIVLAYLGPSASKVMLAYIIAGIVLSIRGDDSRKRRKKKRKVKLRADSGAQSAFREADTEEVDFEIEVEEKIPKLSRTSVRQLDRSLKRLETRMAKLETCVTSGHFKMAKDFRDLARKSDKANTVV